MIKIIIDKFIKTNYILLRILVLLVEFFSYIIFLYVFFGEDSRFEKAEFFMVGVIVFICSKFLSLLIDIANNTRLNLENSSEQLRLLLIIHESNINANYEGSPIIDSKVISKSMKTC